MCLALGVYSPTVASAAANPLSSAQPQRTFEVLTDLVRRTVPSHMLSELFDTAAGSSGSAGGVTSQPLTHSAVAPISLVNLGTCYHAAIGTAQNYANAALCYRTAIALGAAAPTPLPRPSAAPASPAPASLVRAASASSPSAVHAFVRLPSTSAILQSAGHVRAHSLLALMHEWGFGPVPRSELFCEAHYQCAALRGYCYAQRELGGLYAREGAGAKAAGAGGLAAVLHGAGGAAHSAAGGSRYSPPLSFEWYLKAAKQGFTEAQIRVGEMYVASGGAAPARRVVS